MPSRFPRRRHLPLRPHAPSVPTSPLLACRGVEWTVLTLTMPLIDAVTRLRFGRTASSVNTHATNSGRVMTAMNVAISPRQVRPRLRLNSQQKSRHRPRLEIRLGKFVQHALLDAHEKKHDITSSIRLSCFSPERFARNLHTYPPCPNHPVFFSFLLKISPGLQLGSLLALHLPSPLMPPQRPSSLILPPASFAPTRLRHK